jgi:hypothetical protein
LNLRPLDPQLNAGSTACSCPFFKLESQSTCQSKGVPCPGYLIMVGDTGGGYFPGIRTLCPRGACLRVARVDQGRPAAASRQPRLLRRHQLRPPRLAFYFGSGVMIDALGFIRAVKIEPFRYNGYDFMGAGRPSVRACEPGFRVPICQWLITRSIGSHCVELVRTASEMASLKATRAS